MGEILKKIENPGDLKNLSLTELEVLCKEIRELIIETVGKNGGHLSSNLGVVELTVALHRIFNCPEDKIIWDVGHQCYPHKILTGRKKRFFTLRKEGGISGFPRREESPCDSFNTGHGGTSLSAALGMACARELRGEDFHIVTVIGDGSLSCGLTYEALNNLGSLPKKLLVILNDNKLSISPTVGAISSYLNRLRTAPQYNKLREEIKRFIERFPFFRKEGLDLIRRWERHIKGLFLPGSFFEELGIRYFGPLDGHNLKELISILQYLKELPGPLLLHILTRKGKGYPPAEADPSSYHSTPPFEPRTGRRKKRKKKTWGELAGEILVRLARENEKIVAITAAMPEGTGLTEFQRRFPERFFDTGIAEEHAVTFSGGLASQGLKPFVAIYSTFLQRAYDQILHDICLQSLPVVFLIDRAGVVGGDGPTHQGIFDLAYLRSLPNLVVMAPSTEEELANMIFTALELETPVAIRYPKEEVRKEPEEGPLQKIELGKVEVLQEGKEKAIFALGSMVLPAKRALEKLKRKDIWLINARFLKPLSKEFLFQFFPHLKLILTLEEGVLEGGFGSAIGEFLHSHSFAGIKLQKLGLPSLFSQGEREEILQKFGLNEEGIAKKIKELEGVEGE